MVEEQDKKRKAETLQKNQETAVFGFEGRWEIVEKQLVPGQKQSADRRDLGVLVGRPQTIPSPPPVADAPPAKLKDKKDSKA